MTTRISGAATICLLLAGLFVVGCGPSSDSTALSSAPGDNAVVPGVVLRADPNPVPSGTETGKTIITWQTGSEAEADIFYVSGTEETLFATGARGSKEASFLKPGPTEFRLYNHGQRKLVTNLIVTMESH